MVTIQVRLFYLKIFRTARIEHNDFVSNFKSVNKEHLKSVCVCAFCASKKYGPHCFTWTRHQVTAGADCWRAGFYQLLYNNSAQQEDKICEKSQIASLH